MILFLIALISTFHLTDGAAWSFHDSYLSFSPRTNHLTVEESLSVRERECTWQKNNKKIAQRITSSWPGFEPTTSFSWAPSTRPWRPARKIIVNVFHNTGHQFTKMLWINFVPRIIADKNGFGCSFLAQRPKQMIFKSTNPLFAQHRPWINHHVADQSNKKRLFYLKRVSVFKFIWSLDSEWQLKRLKKSLAEIRGKTDSYIFSERF